MIRIPKIIQEIRLYLEFIRIIKREKISSQFWLRKNLRVDRLNRIYTVVNLPPQVTMATDLPKNVRPSFVVTEIKPINEYFKSLNLEELLTMWIKPVEGTNDESYLVVYQFLFRNITWLWIIRILCEISLALLVVYNWAYLKSLIG
jgi:hypothetical protein